MVYVTAPDVTASVARPGDVGIFVTIEINTFLENIFSNLFC